MVNRQVVLAWPTKLSTLLVTGSTVTEVNASTCAGLANKKMAPHTNNAVIKKIKCFFILLIILKLKKPAIKKLADFIIKTLFSFYLTR